MRAWMVAKWNPSLQPREESQERVQKQRYLRNGSSKMGAALRPGEAAASLRADVMSTKPQGRSAAHGRMCGAESATVAIQLEHPKTGRGNQKKNNS